MNSVDLSSYRNDSYNPGAGIVKRALWYFTNRLFFVSGLWPFRVLKVLLLRAFGAHVGVGVNVKPSVNIKYPWRLTVGDNTWIGEQVWIDNIANVEIGSHCCVSQGAMLLTGSHDYSRTTFDLIAAPVVLEDGVWIGAKAIVCPGVRCGSHAVLTVHSVATSDLEPYAVYRGHPAVKTKDRKIESGESIED